MVNLWIWMIYHVVMTNIAIEHGHIDSEFFFPTQHGDFPEFVYLTIGQQRFVGSISEFSSTSSSENQG